MGRSASYYLLADGRVVLRQEEPPEWLERYDSLEIMRSALTTPDGKATVFRAKLAAMAANDWPGGGMH